jgi:hypothetical protein
MPYALSWFAVLSLLAVWSLAVWTFHAAAAWAASRTDGLMGASAQEGLRLPDWLVAWFPPEVAQIFSAALSSVMPAIDAMLNQAPVLATALSAVVWGVWAIGLILLIVLGAGLHGLIAALRRRSSKRVTLPGQAKAAV